MSLFWKSSDANNIGDRVWMTTEMKYNKLAADAKSNMAAGKLVFVASYFENSEAAVASILKNTSTEYIKVHDALSCDQAKINILEVRTLQSEFFITRLRQTNYEIVVLFSEHYPLFGTENSIISSMRILGTKCSYCFYVAFDEPLLQKFGAEKILALLSKLGMEKDEMISHPLISKAIVNIQKKIESEITNEMRANSVEEWFDRNLRNISMK